MDVKLVSPILTSNTVNKNTVLKYIVNPTIKGNDKYYYTFTYYGDNKLVNKPVCKDIINNNSISSTFTVDKKDMYGVWSVYKDSSCSKNSIIKRLETDKYNYLVDSINLKLNNNKLSVGDSVKIDATIKSDYKVDNNSIKWDSTNTSVATVSKDGLVTAKKAGKTNIVATAGGVSASKEIIVVENEMDIKCPLIEYEDKNGKTFFTVTPDSSISQYEVYLSVNDYAGSNADYKLISNNSGKKTFNNLYKNHYSNQAKIKVYTKTGRTRNCYTPPLTMQKNTKSTLATCPKITYSFDKINNANNYNYKMKNVRSNSGYSKMYVFYNQKEEFQYSWYTSNKDGSYKLFKTYVASNKNVKPSVTAQAYDRNGQIVVTDKKGNSIVCKTENVNSINFNKEVIGETNVYTEKGFSSYEKSNIKSVMLSLYKENKTFLALSNVFLYKKGTFENKYGGSYCGMHSSDNKIEINGADYCGGEYMKGIIKHEIGHSINFMYFKIKNKKIYDIRLGNSSVCDYYSTYKNNANYRYRYLRDYSYTNCNEFWAELFSYDLLNVKIDNSLKNIRKKALDEYNKMYKENKSEWNKIKESYK